MAVSAPSPSPQPLPEARASPLQPRKRGTGARGAASLSLYAGTHSLSSKQSLAGLFLPPPLSAR